MTDKAEEKDHTKINEEIPVDKDGGRPKSKKELRLERKAAKKKLAEQADSKATNEAEKTDGSTYLDKEESQRLKKLRRKEQRKEQEKQMRKELQEEKKIRKRKKINRELNAKGGAKKKQKTIEGHHSEEPTSNKNNSSSSKKKKKDASRAEQDVSMNAFRSVLYGTSAGPSNTSGGMTTTRLGVQYQDKVVGTGNLLKEGKPITVKYELTGGKFGAVLDSSKKFTFRPGMGEVIQGWDIGLEGMREGGRRKLIIPPKAGYGGKDIGAGPGALLYFDVTLLSCGR